MKNAMENNAVQLVPKRNFRTDSVLLYPIHADIHLPFDGMAAISQVKSYNVCVIIVLQISLVDLEQKCIGTKNNVQRSYSPGVSLKHRIDRLLQFLSIPQRAGRLKMEVYHWSELFISEIVIALQKPKLHLLLIYDQEVIRTFTGGIR